MMKKVGLLLVFFCMGLASLWAVTYPSESFSLSAPSISYAPAVAPSPCAGEGDTREERESCCTALLLSCVESCGADDACREGCEDSYVACMETGEHSLPLDGGEWLLFGLLAVFASVRLLRIRTVVGNLK